MRNRVKTKKNQDNLMALGILSALITSLTVGGCAADRKKDPQSQQQAQTIVKNAAGNLNPSISTPTELEGTWLSPCVAETYASGARSKTVGFVFMGNSFYKQVDYYATANCTWDTDETLAEGRVGGSSAAGWFAIANGQNGLKELNMESAPNFGSRYELNVYSVQGTGTSKVLWMGETQAYSTIRPTQVSVQYVHWDTTTYGQ